MLEESGLSAKYWEHAAHHVAYVKNRLFSKSLGKSPQEVLTNHKPSLHYIRVFGSPAFVYDEDPKSKVHARAEPGIYLGSDDYGVFTCELLRNRKIVRSRHVTFDEAEFPALEFGSSSSDGTDGNDATFEDNDTTVSSTSDCSDTVVRIVPGNEQTNSPSTD